MMMKIKTYLIIIIAALAAFFMTILKAFRLGQKSEQEKKIAKDLKAAQSRLEIEDEINNKSDNAIRDALRNWMRKP